MSWDIGAIEYAAGVPLPPTGDTTLPTIQFVTPSGATFSSNGVRVRLAANDNDAVVRVEVFRSGHTAPIAVSGEAQLPAGTIYLYWQAVSIPKGRYTLTAYAYDVAGNRSLPASIEVIRK